MRHSICEMADCPRQLIRFINSSNMDSSESDSLFGSDFINKEPSSVMTDDSDHTKARKQEWKQ